MPTPSKILTKEDILRAQKMTRSNMAAARYLHCSYNHYKKYAKMYKNDEGISLLKSNLENIKNRVWGDFPIKNLEIKEDKYF